MGGKKTMGGEKYKIKDVSPNHWKKINEIGEWNVDTCPFYLGPQDFLHGVWVVKHHKSKVWQLSADSFGVDPQLYHISISCNTRRKKIKKMIQKVQTKFGHRPKRAGTYSWRTPWVRFRQCHVEGCPQKAGGCRGTERYAGCPRHPSRSLLCHLQIEQFHSCLAEEFTQQPNI